MSSVSNIDTTEPADGSDVSKADLRGQMQAISDYIASNQDEIGLPYIGWTNLSDADLTVDADVTRRLIAATDNLTAARTITLPTSGVNFVGPLGHDLNANAQYLFVYDIVRPPAAAPSSFALNVTPLAETTTAAAVGSGEWMRVGYYDGGWHVIGFGSLVSASGGSSGSSDQTAILSTVSGSGGSVVLDLSAGVGAAAKQGIHIVFSPTADLTAAPTFSNVPATGRALYVTLRVEQPGSANYAFPLGISGVTWFNGTPTITRSNGKSDIFGFIFEGTSGKVYGDVLKQNLS